jgi:hypothetical protein
LPALGQRCLRLAAKMIRVCSNAVQCHVTLSRHAQVLLCLRERLSSFPHFYIELGRGDGRKVQTQTQGLGGGDGEDREEEGGEEASLALLSRLEDLGIGEDEMEACQGVCSELEKMWLLSDAGQLKAAKDAQVLLLLDYPLCRLPLILLPLGRRPRLVLLHA